MKTLRNINFYFLLALCSLALLGCSKKVDENKPLPEVRTEADQMSVDQLRQMAMKYKDAILAKRG